MKKSFYVLFGTIFAAAIITASYAAIADNAAVVATSILCAILSFDILCHDNSALAK